MANLVRGPGLEPKPSASLIRNMEAPSGASIPLSSVRYPVPTVPLTAPEPEIHRKIMASQRLASQAMELARHLVNQLRGDDPWRADKTRDAINNLLAEIGAWAETNQCEDALKQFIERSKEDGEIQGTSGRND